MMAAGLRPLQQCEDLLFDCQFAGVWQLKSLSGEDLDSIVSPGIVRSRDDHTCVKFTRTSQIGNARSSYDSGAMYLDVARRQAEGNPVRDPAARFARILADD